MRFARRACPTPGGSPQALPALPRVPLHWHRNRGERPPRPDCAGSPGQTGSVQRSSNTGTTWQTLPPTGELTAYYRSRVAEFSRLEEDYLCRLEALQLSVEERHQVRDQPTRSLTAGRFEPHAQRPCCNSMAHRKQAPRPPDSSLETLCVPAGALAVSARGVRDRGPASGAERCQGRSLFFFLITLEPRVE